MHDIHEFTNNPVKRTVTDYTKNGRCSGCGMCCSNQIPMSDKEIQRIRKYVRQHNIRPHQINLPLVNHTIDATCPFLNMDAKTDRCNIYPVRPFICRMFSCNAKARQEQYDKIMHDKDRYRDERRLTNMRETFFKK